MRVLVSGSLMLQMRDIGGVEMGRGREDRREVLGSRRGGGKVIMEVVLKTVLDVVIEVAIHVMLLALWRGVVGAEALVGAAEQAARSLTGSV